MTPELIGILAVGAALAGLIFTGQRNLAQRISETNQRIDRLEARMDSQYRWMEDQFSKLDGRLRVVEHGMARLEGLLEGLREAITGRRAA